MPWADPIGRGGDVEYNDVWFSEEAIVDGNHDPKFIVKGPK